MAAHLTVHSLHINIDAGDSSIHLLVDEKRTAADTTRPAVVRSILIDGGWTKVTDSRVQGKLTGILGEIGQMYQWPAANGYDNNQPAFDAIVITHYDGDHWGGISDLILDDLSTASASQDFRRLVARSGQLLTPSFNGGDFFTTFNNNTNKWSFWRDNFDLVDALQPNVFLKSRYMKYSTGGANPPTIFRLDPSRRQAPLFADAAVALHDPAFGEYPPAPLPSQTSTLRTTLYVPYVSRREQKVGARVFKRFLGPQKKTKPCPQFSFNRTTKDYDAAGGNTLAIRLPLAYTIPVVPTAPDPGRPWPKNMVAELTQLQTNPDYQALHLSKKREFIACDICKVVGMRDQYLGTELFFGTSLPGAIGTWKTILSPSQLLSAVFRTVTPEAPLGLFIVAGDQRVLGTTVLADKTEIDTPAPVVAATGLHATALGAEDTVTISEDVVASHGDGRHTHEVNRMVDVHHGTTVAFSALPATDYRKDSTLRNGSVQMNQPSIVCMLLSTDKNRDVDIFHFLGGDALWDIEATVANWVTPLAFPLAFQDGVPVRDNNWTADIPMMKASHHGGAESMPLVLLKVLTPKCILFPNASGTAKYGGTFGHPRWEILLCLRAFFELMDGPPDEEGHSGFRNDHVFALNYPYYLRNDRPIGLSMKRMMRAFSIDSRLAGDRATGWSPTNADMLTFQDFRNAMQQLYDEALIKFEEPYLIWEKWGYHDLSKYWSRGMTVAREEVSAEYQEKVIERFKFMAALCRNAWQLMSPQPATADIRCFQATFDPAAPRQRPALHQWDGQNPRVPPTPVQPTFVGLQNDIMNQNALFWSSLRRRKRRADQEASAAAELSDLASRPDVSGLPFDSTPSSLSLSAAFAAASSSSSSSSSSMAVESLDDDTSYPIDIDEEAGGVANPFKRRRQNDDSGSSKDEQKGDDDGMVQSTFFALGRDSFPVRLAQNRITNLEAAPAAAIPPAATAATTTAAASGYDLLSTGFPDEAPSDQQAPLTPGLVDDFIRLTGAGYLNVRSKPTSSGPVEAPADTNEWIARLFHSGLNISLVNMAGTVDATTGQATVSALEVTLDPLGLHQPLLFSTAQCSLAVTGQADAGNAIFSDAALGKFKMLSLGLKPLDNDGSGSPPPSRDVSLAAVSLAFAPSWLQPLTTLFSLAAGTMLTVDDSAGARSLLTLSPDDRSTTWLRLAFKFHDEAAFKGQFKSLMSFLHADVEISSFRIVGRRTAMTVPRDKNTALVEKRDIAIQAVFTVSSTIAIDVYVTFQQDATKLVLRFRSGGPSAVPTALFSGRALGDDVFDPRSLIPHSDDFAISLSELSLTLSNPGSASGSGSRSFGIKSASARFELKLFGAPFSATISGLPGQFAELGVELWTVLRPTYNPLMLACLEDTDLHAPPRGVDPQPISLASLVPGLRASDLPAGLRLEIARASLRVRRLVDGSADVHFEGMIACDPSASTDVPCARLDYVSVTATCNRSSAGQTAWDLSLSTRVALRPRSLADYDPAFLNFSAAYTHATDTWLLKGGAVGLQFAALYSLFDGDAQGPVMDVLEEISIPSIEVAFTFGPGQSSLLATGMLEIGPLALDLLYSYTKQQDQDKQWRFQAQLGAVNSSTKLVDLLSSLDPGSTLLDKLHDVPFVRDIEFPAMGDGAAAADPSSDSAGDGTTLPDDAPVYFSISQSDAGLTVWLKLAFDTPEGAVSLLFVQYVPKAAPAAAAPAGGGSPPAAAKPLPKRLLRVSLDHLPQLPDIPVYGPVAQPVDALEYVLVHDTTTAAPNAPLGFTRDEIADVNQSLPSAAQVLFRDRAKPNPTPSGGKPATPEYVLLNGHHFMIVASGKVAVDHVFGAQQPSPTPASGGSSGGEVPVIPGPVVPSPPAQETPDSVKGDSGPTMGPSSKKLGPLTIANVGLQVKDGNLFLLLDATVMLGAIEMTLIGLRIGFPISKVSFNKLATLRPTDFSLDITGISVYLNAPPVMIAGMFEKQSTADFEAYMGGVAVSIQPYTLLALGEYQHTKKPTDFKSVFVFARLDGPLVTLEFAEISGVEVGFGYNYDLRLPAPLEVPNFPLLETASMPSNLMDLITTASTSPSSFHQWLTAKEGAVWFALGMKIDALQVLSIQAAAIVQLGATGSKVALVGVASASMPPSKSPRPAAEGAVLFVEYAMAAVLDITGGSFCESAVLTPNSFILYPDCHLHGGYAMSYWFYPNPHAGDWVFTVGGYHPAFQRPDHYPVVPGVGISWSLLGGLVTIEGDAFFAVCPKAAMAGGHLLATFSAGPLYAAFKAWAAFLVNFSPFFFVADISVSISVGLRIDLLFATIYLTASSGASLHLQGPPFGGSVHVDVGFIGVTIPFGAQPPKKAPLTFPQFLDVAKAPGPGSTDKAGAGANGSMVAILIVDGSANDQNKKAVRKAADASDPWFVRAGAFRFRVETKFPVTKLRLGRSADETTWVETDQKTNDVFARLMGPTVTDAVPSKMTVVITPPPPESHANPWIVNKIVRGMPEALWKSYSSGDDPMGDGGNNIDSVLAQPGTKGTIDHTAGFSFTTPNPRVPDQNLPRFNALQAMQQSVLELAETPALPPSAPTQDAGLAPSARPAAPAQKWTDAKAAWTAADDGVSKFLADSMVALFGWSVAVPVADASASSSTDGSSGGGAVPATTGTSTGGAITGGQAAVGVGTLRSVPVQLQAARPTGLIGRFADAYMGCPYLSVETY